jgi:hypothetical protein
MDLRKYTPPGRPFKFPSNPIEQIPPHGVEREVKPHHHGGKEKMKILCKRAQRFLSVIECLQEIRTATENPLECHQCLREDAAQWKEDKPAHSKPASNSFQEARL